MDNLIFGTYKVKEQKKAIKRAIELGFGTIDTAILYENHNIISEIINEYYFPRH